MIREKVEGGLLEKKVALVTGAARGIGRVIAKMMANEGATVVVTDISADIVNTAEEIKQSGGDSISAVFDISNPRQISDNLSVIRKATGDIQILVNNAGIVNNIAGVRDMSHEDWNREINTNLTGPFNMIKELIGPMIDAGWGRIINFSSIGATGGLHKQCAYAASKAGVIGLTKTVAVEYAKYNITCNAIVPGLIGTELVNSMPVEIRQRAIEAIPAQRMGTMEEVANLVCFLSSEKASYINGEEIRIDGGIRLNTVSFASRRESRKEKFV